MEFIKTILKSILSMIILSFMFGYVLGNYYGVRSSVNEPNKFNVSIIPAYTILLFQGNKEIEKYSPSDTFGK